MLYSTVILLLLVVFYPSPGNTTLSKEGFRATKSMMKNICKQNTGVKQELLDRLKSGEFVEDPKLKCYINCCLEMMRAMKKGKITPNEAVKQAEALLPEDIKELTLKQIHACKDTSGKNACDVAFKFAKCGYIVEPNNMLIPI